MQESVDTVTKLPPILSISNLVFRWPGQSKATLQIPRWDIDAHDTVFLYGPSGSGKSTLLSLLAGVLLPQEGSIAINGQNWLNLNRSARDRYRADQLGYIFQQFNLLPYLSLYDNVLLPCRFSRTRAQAAIRQHASLENAAHYWLDGMGIAKSQFHTPARHLSVGQQQRVAAARALIGAPPLIVADEPTSALDEDRRDSFMDLLMHACRSQNSTLIFVSHDRRLASRFSKQVDLRSINQAPTFADLKDDQ